jgi:hypothetical protein
MNPLSAVENVAKLFVQDRITSSSLSIPTYSVFGGISNDDDTLPCVVCYAESAEELEPNNEIDWWKVKLNVMVFHPAKRSVRVTATEDARLIFDSFFDVNGAAALQGITSSFHVAEIQDKRFFNNVQQDAWAQSIECSVICTPN